MSEKRSYDLPRLGCPKCDSGWIYVNDHTVPVIDNVNGAQEYPYDQVTACPRCLPQHVKTRRRRDEPPPSQDTRRDLE